MLKIKISLMRSRFRCFLCKVIFQAFTVSLIAFFNLNNSLAETPNQSLKSSPKTIKINSGINQDHSVLAAKPLGSAHNKVKPAIKPLASPIKIKPNNVSKTKNNISKKKDFAHSRWRPYIAGMYVKTNSKMTHNSDYQIGPIQTTAVDFKSYSSPLTYNKGTVRGASVIVGAGYLFKNNFYFAVEGEIYINKHLQLNNSLAESGQHKAPFLGTFSFKPLGNAGIRAGYSIMGIAMPYIKVGLAAYDTFSSPIEQILNGVYGSVTDGSGHVWLNSDEAHKFANAMKVDKSLFSLYMGAGLEWKLTKHFSLRTEYSYSAIQTPYGSYEKIDYEGGLVFNVDNNVTKFKVHHFKSGLVYTF